MVPGHSVFFGVLTIRKLLVFKIFFAAWVNDGACGFFGSFPGSGKGEGTAVAVGG